MTKTIEIRDAARGEKEISWQEKYRLAYEESIHLPTDQETYEDKNYTHDEEPGAEYFGYMDSIAKGYAAEAKGSIENIENIEAV